MRSTWPSLRCRGEGRIGGFGPQPDFAADELQAAVANQRAGQQAGFHQNLEPVADAQHQSAIGGEALAPPA